LKNTGAEKQAAAAAGDDNNKSSSDSDDTSDSSSSDSEEEESDSSDSSEEEADVNVKESHKSTPKGLPEVETPKADEDMEEEDDFLVAVDEGKEQDNFANAKNHLPTSDEFKGDKSKGWSTQRQRPGQFKKKRIRR
jgi:hypothetical protein